MTNLRIAICDDDPQAVRRLASLLAMVPCATVVGTTTDGAEIVEIVAMTKPDLLLLDIEMPDLDGFDVVAALAKKCGDETPLVAFITGYRKFASQAFETGAIDFLPKPMRLGRLEITLSRARASLQSREAGVRLLALQATIDRLRTIHASDIDEHVWVTRRGEVLRIDFDRIERISAEGAYVRLYVDGTSYLHREPIGSMLQRLDKDHFVRVHRSHLVQLDRVASIRRTLHGGAELFLKDGSRVPLGRKFSRDARKRLLHAKEPGTAT